MFKKLLSAASHLFNWLLCIVVVIIQFVLASNAETFTWNSITLTAEQLALIARMCVGILTLRFILYFSPQIKRWFGK